jgi:DNA-binding MarR family transcriptional regulator
MHLQTMHMHIIMNKFQQQKKSLRTDASTVVKLCAGLNSRFAARRITQFLDRELMDSGLSVAQFGLMAQIGSATDDTLSALARRTGLDQSTLSRNLRTLEADGLVEIVMVESDLRRRMVWLTETGAKRLERAIPIWRRAHAKLSRSLAPELAQRLALEADSLTADLT